MVSTGAEFALDFRARGQVYIHAVSYVYSAALICHGKCDAAWSASTGWMKNTWQGNVGEVIPQLKEHQLRLGLPPDDASDADPREQLRCVIQYLMMLASSLMISRTSAWMDENAAESR